MSTPTETPNRRTILAAAGAIGASALLPVASASERDEPCHGYEGRVCTLRCDQPEKRPSQTECSPCEAEEWADSALTVHNCSPCPRKLYMSVSGKASTNQHLTRGAVEDQSADCDIMIPPGERMTIWFTGQMHRLETEHGDLNIAISQRSLHESHYCK